MVEDIFKDAKCCIGSQKETNKLVLCRVTTMWVLRSWARGVPTPPPLRGPPPPTNGGASAPSGSFVPHIYTYSSRGLKIDFIPSN